MIKFFRQIRYGLMSKNKTGKYLKYAIGEIVLVVIGILIALQINNWNENNKQDKVEQATLKALLSEFKDNRAAIKSCLEEIKDFRADGDSLRRYIGPELAKIDKDSLNKLLGDVGSTAKCVVAIDVLKDVQSSGKLNLIDNEDVRKAISRWSSQLKDLQGEEQDWVQEFSNQFVPYANKWIQWEDVDYLYHDEDTIRYSCLLYTSDAADD